MSSPARTISSEILERTKRPSFRSDGWLTVACPPPLLHVAATAKIFGTAMHGSGWCGGCRSFGSSTQSCLPAHWCDQPRANASSEQLPGVYFPQPAATSTAPKSANVMVSVAEASSQRSSTVPIPYLKACLRQRGWACEGRRRVLCCRSYGGRFACVATAQKGSPSAPLALLKSFADPLPSCSGWRSGECCCSRRPQGMGHSSRGRESPPAVMGGTIFTPASALFAQNSRSGAAIPCSNGMPPTALRCTE